MYRALNAIKDRDKDGRLRCVGCQLSRMRMLVVVDLETFSLNGSLAAGLLTKVAEPANQKLEDLGSARKPLSIAAVSRSISALSI